MTYLVLWSFSDPRRFLSFAIIYYDLPGALAFLTLEDSLALLLYTMTYLVLWSFSDPRRFLSFAIIYYDLPGALELF